MSAKTNVSLHVQIIMDLSKEPLMQGLYANPKWIPCWYQYDELGSRMFERAAYDNPYYYIYKSECPVLEKHKKVNSVSSFW